MTIPLNGHKVLAAVASALNHAPATDSAADLIAGSPSLTRVARKSRAVNPHAVETIKENPAALLAEAIQGEGASTWPYELSEPTTETPPRQRAVDPARQGSLADATTGNRKAVDPTQGIGIEIVDHRDPLERALTKLVNGR